MLHLSLLLPQHFVYSPHPLHQFVSMLVDRAILLRNMVGEMVEDSSLSADHQEIDSLTSAGVRGTMIGPRDLRQYRVPFFLTKAEEQAPECIT